MDNLNLALHFGLECFTTKLLCMHSRESYWMLYQSGNLEKCFLIVRALGANRTLWSPWNQWNSGAAEFSPVSACSNFYMAFLSAPPHILSFLSALQGLLNEALNSCKFDFLKFNTPKYLSTLYWTCGDFFTWWRGQEFKEPSASRSRPISLRFWATFEINIWIPIPNPTSTFANEKLLII